MSNDRKRKHYSTSDGTTQKRGSKKTKDTNFVPAPIIHRLPSGSRVTTPPRPQSKELLLPEYQEELGRLRGEIADVDRQLSADERAGRETSVDLLIKRESLKSEMIELRNQVHQEISNPLLNDIELREPVSTLAIKNELLLEKQKQLKVAKDLETDFDKKATTKESRTWKEAVDKIKKETANKKAGHYTVQGRETQGKLLGVDGRNVGFEAGTFGRLKGGGKKMYGVDLTGDRSLVKHGYVVRMDSTINDEKSQENALAAVFKEMKIANSSKVAENVMKDQHAKGEIKKFFRKSDNDNEKYSSLKLNEKDGRIRLTVGRQRNVRG